MKNFVKNNYSILIPIFLLVVILIAILLYTREYKNNRYANLDEIEVYQYFSNSKVEFDAVIGRNRKNVILSFENKEFDVSLGSTPIYLKDNDSVIFPKEMSMVFPLKDREYLVNSLSEIYKENELYYLNIRDLNKSYNHCFLYDGKNLYFFIDEVSIVIGNQVIKLSPMSYVSYSYLNLLEYYDKESDTYAQIDITSGDVYVENDYMKVDIGLDKVIYEKSFTLLTNNFSALSKITDMPKE